MRVPSCRIGPRSMTRREAAGQGRGRGGRGGRGRAGVRESRRECARWAGFCVLGCPRPGMARKGRGSTCRAFPLPGTPVDSQWREPPRRAALGGFGCVCAPTVSGPRVRGTRPRARGGAGGAGGGRRATGCSSGPTSRGSKQTAGGWCVGGVSGCRTVWRCRWRGLAAGAPSLSRESRGKATSHGSGAQLSVSRGAPELSRPRRRCQCRPLPLARPPGPATWRRSGRRQGTGGSGEREGPSRHRNSRRGLPRLLACKVRLVESLAARSRGHGGRGGQTEGLGSRQTAVRLGAGGQSCKAQGRGHLRAWLPWCCSRRWGQGRREWFGPAGDVGPPGPRPRPNGTTRGSPLCWRRRGHGLTLRLHARGTFTQMAVVLFALPV